MKIACGQFPSYFVIGIIGLLAFSGSGGMMTYAQEAEVIPVGIAPLSSRVALLEFPLSVYPFNEPNKPPQIRFQELAELKVTFEDRTVGRAGLNVNEDFLPLSASALSSGLALFKESGAMRGFNYAVGDQSSDLPIDLLVRPVVEADPLVEGKFTVTFTPRPGSPYVQLPYFKDQFADFYVVARTSLDLLHGDRFEVSIPANGIKIRDLRQTLPRDTLYDDRFPGPAFADMNVEFTKPAIFEGDIVQIASVVSDMDNSNRIDASSEPTAVLGIDLIGRADQEYFLQELRVNWIGINLGAVARLMANLTQPLYRGARTAGVEAMLQTGMIDQSSQFPTFFYSPWFYNVPVDFETGELLTTLAPGDGETVMPLTMPLDLYGFPRVAFMIGADNPTSHITSYVPYGPRPPYADGVTPRVVSQDIFQALRADAAGGVFLYRELGGTRGKYDAGVDRLINLDASKFTVESFEISPEAARDPSSPLNHILKRLLPGQVGGQAGKEFMPFLLGDDNLATMLMGVLELPDPAKAPRPPLGSLECIMDPDCYFFDLIINILRPYLGLTEGQLRYLYDYTEGNGRTNSEDLFDFQLVQGFTFVLPVAKNNAISDLLAPTDRTGTNAGPEIYLAIRTSDELRNLDSFIPFIGPNDITIGTNLNQFTKGNMDAVQLLKSVSSIGYSRPNTSSTSPMIGRPRPRFQFRDLTLPGEGPFASNDNVLFDRSQNSPPKAVIGIDVQDLGQNANLVDNLETIEFNLFDTFFSENTVLGEIQVDFLPAPQSLVFNSLVLSAIPLELGVDNQFFRLVSSHSVALYFDDDTPNGNGYDDDGDGLVDEELYNLQDDDGDGLIDEDLGDGTPVGVNGVFDTMDRFYPTYTDNFGSTSVFQQAVYVFEPNSQTKYQNFINAIQPANQPFNLVAGGLLPLNVGEGSWFAELDMRALGYTSWQTVRNQMFPPTGGRFFSGSTYNVGMISSPLETRTGLIDLIPMIRARGGDFSDFPYYPDDLFVVDPAAPTGPKIWMLVLTSQSDTDVPVLPDPNGDVRASWALSLASAMRVPNPAMGFVRVGHTPMVVNVPGTNAQNPQGDNMAPSPNYHQFGFDVQTADLNAINQFVTDLVNTLNDAYTNARQAVADFNQAVADAEANADPEAGPEYPELPEPAEINITHPYSGLQMQDFVQTNNGIYTANYMYQIQLPDENFGPLAGDDFYIVLRSSPDAVVGDTFRVRIRSGQRNAFVTTTDPTTGQVTRVPSPEGGISYHSFLETDYSAGGESFRNLSKNQLTTSEIVVRSQNVPPTIRFTSPGPGLNLASSDFQFEIQFTADDPDSVAEIRLYVDTDSRGFDGSFIPGAILREGIDTGFTLNLRDDIPDFDPTKEYFVYARIDDGVNPPVYVYADGSIKTVASPDIGGGGTGGGTGGIVVTGDLQNPLDYVKLSNDGRVFSLGDAPTFSSIESITRVVDMEINSTFSGLIMVQVDGNVLGTGDLGVFRTNLQPNGELLFPQSQIAFYRNSLTGGELILEATESQIRIESARDVEVDWTRGAIYVLDGDGDMLYLGNANTNLRPQPMGIDLYRDMELTPDGNQLYFLTGNGLFSVSGGSSVGSWSNLVEGDVYRDMSLVIQGNTVSNVVITDENGNITVVGSGAIKSRLEALKPPASIAPGTVRQVKLFPGDTTMLMLVQGSGQVTVLGGTDPLLPRDGIVFADQAGLEDDQIVDTETTSINLQSIVEAVRSIIDSFNGENTAKIMAMVSPAYKDPTGANAAGLEQSLRQFFDFYEVESFSESRAVPNHFTISNQGNIITAQVMMDLAVNCPGLEYFVTQVDASAVGGETIGRMLFSESGIPFDQTLRIREVADGRGWVVDIWEIRNFGRRTFELINTQDVQYDDINYLTRLPNNFRTAIYPVMNEQLDPPISVFLDVDEANPLAPYNVLLVIRENWLHRNVSPPAFEFSLYDGTVQLGVPQFDRVNFRFQRDASGKIELISMKLRQVMSQNDSQFLQGLDQPQQLPLASLDGTQVQYPFGFKFSSRGTYFTVFRGDADFVFLDAGTVQVTNQLGGIMMLPENTDIYAINPIQYVNQNISRATVISNPYDPATQTGGTGVSLPGLSASLVAGRSYFVITSDGKRYGFFQIPPEVNLTQQGTFISVPFDYRYEDTFVLPVNF